MPWHPVIASSQLILISGPPMIWMIIFEKRLNKGYLNERNHTSYHNHFSILSDFLSQVKLKSWLVLKNCHSWIMKFTVIKNRIKSWTKHFWHHIDRRMCAKWFFFFGLQKAPKMMVRNFPIRIYMLGELSSK